MIHRAALVVFLALRFIPCQADGPTPPADDPISPVDDQGRVVNFGRDIVPIFKTHCLECHNEDKASNDFRIDDPDSVFSYVEAGDVESSSMYVDYMLSEDPDLLMPPPGHGGPLPPAELALVRLWIEEGADWPEDAMVDGSGEALPERDVVSIASMGLGQRVWTFQGFFHPATVHFPIALLLVGGVFVALGFKWPVIGTQVPLACLWIGSATAIVACMMGWAFAVEKGYGSWAKVDTDSEIFWHRWSAMIVTLVAVVSAIIAAIAVLKNRPGLNPIWKTGLVAVALLIGLVGHQGGELTYGKDFFPKAIRILTGQVDPPTP